MKPMIPKVRPKRRPFIYTFADLINLSDKDREDIRSVYDEADTYLFGKKNGKPLLD